LAQPENSPFDEIYSPDIMILGIGSILFSDDGFGIRVVQRIEKEYEFPDSVLVVDGGRLTPFDRNVAALLPAGR